jgi:hypothetical protein
LGRWHAAHAGRQGLKNRIEVTHDLGLTADHQAVAALQAEHAAARAAVDVLDAALGQLLGALDVVAVIRVAAIDQDVAGAQERSELGDRLVDVGGGHHHPHHAGGLQPRDEISQRLGAGRAFRDHFFDRFRKHVERHARMACAHQASRHVRAHPAESNHSKLHRALLLFGHF